MSAFSTLGRIAAIGVSTLLALCAAYLLAAWTGSSIPGGGAALAGADNVTIWVETNGVHTGIIVPLANDHADLTAFANPADARSAPAGTTHMLVGWGHAGVYRNAPTWRDLRPGDAMSAVIGSNETLLHVTYMAEPRAPSHWQRQVTISADAYRQLVRRLGERFVAGGAVYPGYAHDDVFYQSIGRYSAFNTCNTWTGNLLREAGVPMGIWTPFAGGVMKWLPIVPD